MYRDFVYLDVPRVQSIIAQLQRGVLDKVMEGKTSELQGSAGAAAGVLASFLPIGIEGGYSRQVQVQSSKVLHDYAFNLALESLKEHDLCVEVEELDRDNLLLPSAAFIVARGSASILDYEILKNLAENEPAIDMAMRASRPQASAGDNRQGQGQNKPRKQADRSVIRKMAALADAVMGDAIQVKLRQSNDTLFAGLLVREHLRETTRSFIYKFGGGPQEGWTMLAQVCQITSETGKLAALAEKISGLPGVSDPASVSTATEVLNPALEMLHFFQEALASVTYPAISVTPIALYRELEGMC